MSNYLFSRICSIRGQKGAFLDEPFLKDSWLLLLLICLLFILHAVTELNELFLQIKNPIPTILLKEGTELGILVCTIMLVYKWLRLINPQRG